MKQILINLYRRIKGGQHFSDPGEFYEKIVNIPRNGEWRDSRNLEKYLRVAQKLRDEEGVGDIAIIKYLTAIYVASSLEQNLDDIPFKSFTRRDATILLDSKRDIDEF